MNTNFKTICLALLVCLGLNTFAQRNCESMEVLQQQLEQDPKRQAKLDAIEAFTNAYINAEHRSSAVVTIPVVVHVVYNNSTENISDAQIMSQMTVLNDDFRRTNADADGTWSQAADTEIQFCMATVDPNGNPTTGITRTSTSVTAFGTNDNMKFNSSGGKDAWPASDYLNMWVCDISGGILGYAQFPGGAPATDGVVMDYQYFGTIGTATAPFDLGRTTTHEVGHWLNLRHIWGDGGCSVDDFVSDTPTSDAPNYGCATGHVSCGSTDMVQNYMDYSDDGCMNLFTQGQKDRMQAVLAGTRNSLLSSGACGAPPTPTCSDGIQNGDETGVDCGGSSCPPCAPCTDVTVTINLDNYPEETSWNITDAGGAVVASGGTYGSQPDGSTVTITACLADGCYDFTILDSYGDGICCSYGTGSYTVTTGGSTVASGGSFGSSETTNFCVGGGPAPTCTDGIQNGSETGVDCGGPDCAPCPTCNDGIQNGSETGVDCGGPDCAPCGGGGCTDVTINNEGFESGWGIWNDGGSDCRRSSGDAAYAIGTYCVRLRDNTSTSTMTTDVLNLTGFEEVTIDFTYYPRSMENGEDFWLQASTDGGSSYSTLVSWARGTDFNNNTRYNESIVITGTFNNNIRFRFRNDASGNSDWVYIDEVNISGCVNASRLNEPIVGELNEELDAVVVQSIKTAVTDVTLFPNPTRDDLTVNFMLEEESNLEIMVTDLTGKVVMHDLTRMPAGQNQYRVDASELVSGIYLLHIVDKANAVSRKFVVSK